MVAGRHTWLGYEVYIGRRVDGRTLKGDYSVMATKSFPLSHKKAWQFLLSAAGLKLWLKPITPFQLKKNHKFETQDGYFGEVRTFLAPKRLRLKWQETEWPKATTLQVLIFGHGKNKCDIGIQHEHLSDPRLKEKMRLRWKIALSELVTLCSQNLKKPLREPK